MLFCVLVVLLVAGLPSPSRGQMTRTVGLQVRSESWVANSGFDRAGFARHSPLASQIEVTAANKCAMSSPSVPTRCPITAERGERRMLVARARERALIRQHARVRDQDELEQHGARASAPAVSFRNFALYRVRSIASSSMWFSGRSNRPRTICRAQSASSSADRLASWQSGARRCAVQGADSTCEAVVNVSRSGARRGAPATTSS